QTFLKRIFRLRLSDFLRSLRRNRQRFRAALEVEDWAQKTPEKSFAAPGPQEELQLRLERALRLLDAESRALWDQLSEGKRLRDLPQVLGVSYRTLKRRWQALREQLILAFRHLKE